MEPGKQFRQKQEKENDLKSGRLTIQYHTV